MPVAASQEPIIELRLSDLVVTAYDAIFAGEATELDYRLLAADEAIAALANEAVFSNDLLLAANDALVSANDALVAANDALVVANQALVESLNLCFSDSFTLVPA
jgi:hypothetical protein